MSVAGTAKKYITPRHWSAIASQWLDFLPDLRTAGMTPSSPLSDFPPLVQLVQRSTEKKEPILVDECPGLRQLVFHHAVFLLHKALNVSRAAEAIWGNRLFSWTLSNEYHSALFAAKSIMRFLGVATAEINDRPFILDVFSDYLPPGVSQKSRKQKLALRTPFRILIIPAGSRLENMSQWELMLRLTRVARSDSEIFETVRSTISQLDAKDFGHQRNRLHYADDCWPFEDLISCQEKEDPFAGAAAIGQLGNPELRGSFSVQLVHNLLAVAVAFLKELSESAPLLLPDYGAVAAIVAKHQLHVGL